jgi:transcriptional regulator with XRE-family HTH domain
LTLHVEIALVAARKNVTSLVTNFFPTGLASPISATRLGRRDFLKTDIDQLQFLKDELSRRVAKNPRYSLRSFAKSLGLSHTTLSLALSGKRPLSRKAALQIAERLGLEPDAAAAFVGSNPQFRQHGMPVSFQKIELDTFNLISDWVHYAILSLLDTTDAKFEPKWVARRLGIGESAAKMAMDRLVSLGLLHEVEGRWKQSSLPIKVDNKISTVATRKFQRQLLEKAIDSLENDPVEARDFSSVTLTLDPRHLPYAKERIKQFRRELMVELESRGEPKEVYNLTFQVYPLTQIVKEAL